MRRTPTVIGSAIVAAVLGAAILVPNAGAVARPSAPSGAVVDQTSLLRAGGAYIVQARPGELDALVRDAAKSGVTVTRRLPIINAIAVTVTPKTAAGLTRSTVIAKVARDAAVRPQGFAAKTGAVTTTTAQTTTDEMTAVADDKGSMRWITTLVAADQMWRNGVTGAGVDIAVVDTGVAPVPGLDGKIINGPDISLDVPYTSARGLDAFGHGTHMASIAAGVDPGTSDLSDRSKFVGVAPGSRIVNVKVGAFDGATDVSQVIAGIDWVVQHKTDNGLNIRVLNLSYGTDASLAVADDPLSWAAEVAWRNGIVVVAAAGNDGAQTKVLSPARNPIILAVGAADQTAGKFSSTSFTATSGARQPDVWAPGSHVLGLRVPNSFVDTNFPAARVGVRLFRGTGTSQATAVVSGAAALLLSSHPNATPAQIRAAIMRSGKNVKGETAGTLNVATANGLLNDGAVNAAIDPAVSGTPGTGSLESTRGGVNLVMNGVALQGEKDIFGRTWNGPASAAAAQTLTSWSGGDFNGNSWSGNSWSGNSWSGNSWSGNSWSGNSWSANTWAGNSWSGNSWSGNSWSGNSWSGNSWSGNSWSGNSWSGAGWLGNLWG